MYQILPDPSTAIPCGFPTLAGVYEIPMLKSFAEVIVGENGALPVGELISVDTFAHGLWAMAMAAVAVSTARVPLVPALRVLSNSVLH